MGAVASRWSEASAAPIDLLARSAASQAAMLGCPKCAWLSRACSTPVAAPILSEEAMLEPERLPTPGADSITELCRQLGIPPERTAKAMMFSGSPPGDAGAQTLMALVRGDREVSEQKLSWVSGWTGLRKALPAEIEQIGAVPGYASPVGLDHPWVVVDQDVARARNLATGANAAGYHLIHTSYGRDYSAWLVADLVAAAEGDACPRCGAKLESQQGCLLGLCYPLLPEHRGGLGSLPDQAGRAGALAGVALDFDVTSALGALAGEQSDEQGLSWTPALAPFQALILGLTPCESQAVEVYLALRGQGVPVLLDDRDCSAGVKFKDADLIGIPLRVVVSPKSIAAGGAEIALRADGAKKIVPLEAIEDEIRKFAV
jgi:prolyl-tRNA synthetase